MTAISRIALRHRTLALIVAAIILTLTAISSSCSGSESNTDRPAAVPRPTAYPRIDLYDTVMKPVDAVLPLVWLANSQATVTLPQRNVSDDGSTRWLNIEYPRYGVIMYCTFIDVDPSRLQAELDNRIERISLNIGSNRTEVLEINTPSGFSSRLLVTPHGSVTPVQFLTTDLNRRIISGAAFLKSAPPAGAADSIAPIVNALRDDMIRTLSGVR